MNMEKWLILFLMVLSFFLFMLLILKSRGRHHGKEGEGLLDMGRRLEQLDLLVRQMDQMNKIFQSPRLRGGVGEVLLEDMIRNRLPRGAYDFQYSFSGGQRADAVIYMGNYKVAVDAKFPLEQTAPLFEAKAREIPAAVKKIFLKHGRSIAEKYILPREGTLPFALMYIPSENLYYHVFIAEGASLTEELLAMGIVPVSPSSLFCYLQTVLYGFRGFSFSSRSRDIMRLVGQIRRDFDLLKGQLNTAATHLKNFQKVWNDSRTSLDTMEGNICSLDGKDNELDYK